MNCLEFRHHLLTNPYQEDAGFTRHRASCPNCAREAQQARQFENRLRAAVMVEIPEGLQARILLAQALDKRRRLPRLQPRSLALAASLLLAIGVAGWIGVHDSETLSGPGGLQAAVLNHVNDELNHLYEDHDLRAGQLAGLFGQFGARVDDGIGKVNYAGRCTIRKHSGLHLVVPGQQGPVTILFMPGEHPPARQAIRTERFSAVIVPTDYGSMAIVGERGEDLDDVMARVSQHVAWGI